VTTQGLATAKVKWIGWIMSGLIIAFMAFDGGIKLVPLQPVLDASSQLGLPKGAGFARGLGFLALTCTALYAIPRTSILGAILLTGYLGGAIAMQLRVGAPLLSHVLFGVYLGLLVWGGLWLRNDLLRRLIPLCKPMRN
jgi:DoxX-like family